MTAQFHGFFAISEVIDRVRCDYTKVEIIVSLEQASLQISIFFLFGHLLPDSIGHKKWFDCAVMYFFYFYFHGGIIFSTK